MRHSQRIKQAVRIIMDPETDTDNLLLQLALESPAAVLSAARFRERPEWMKLAESFIEAEKKIHAIKAVREGDRFKNLKEAKEAVEYYQEHRMWPV